jgi:NAD-dependent dihydropyrimidine dehydrogenase PreA subunit
MTDEKKPDRGRLEIDEEECKGCGLCIEACPPKVISLSERLNHFGYRTALYLGRGCTACGICFMACPEPGAITVLRLVSAQKVEAHDSHPFRDEAAEKDGATRSGLGGAAT